MKKKNEDIDKLYISIQNNAKLREALDDKVSKILNKEKSVQRPRIEVNKYTGCWDFIGGHTKKGYSYYNFQIEGFKTSLEVYKVFKIFYATEPLDISDFDFSHKCGRSSCVKPGHIFLETRSSNLKRKRCHKIKRCQCGKGGNPRETHPCLFGKN